LGEQNFAPHHVKPNLTTPEFEFTVVVLQILYWIYVNAIHSRVFILDLPTNIDSSFQEVVPARGFLA
jgi:hypothetical protein